MCREKFNDKTELMHVKPWSKTYVGDLKQKSKDSFANVWYGYWRIILLMYSMVIGSDNFIYYRTKNNALKNIL